MCYRNFLFYDVTIIGITKEFYHIKCELFSLAVDLF